ncbi:MAG: SDR family oxidoreductase, partial [Candidatus Marinimicrobia bacterium]|nr:SDR family oxidoreductase [Candidatus Neomarinimicrobiota bacterium]
AIRTDISRLEDCRNLIARTVERYGTLDYLVLNAGVSMWARFEDVTDLSIYSKLMETNYLGPVNCIHSAMPHLRESRGSIVAISSLQGKVGIPFHTGYSASKHALQGFLDALAAEEDAIHILTVMPTWIKGTSLRSNAYGPDGKMMGPSKRAHNSDAVTVEEVSRKIIKAMVQRKSEVVIPGKLKLLLWLQLIAPKFLRKLIRNRVTQQDSAT